MSVHFVEGHFDRMDFARWYRQIPTWDWVACDVETTGLDPWNDKLRLVQFGTESDAWALPYPEQADMIEEIGRAHV